MKEVNAPDMQRLFIAISFDEAVKDSIYNAVNRLRAYSIKGNFTRRENLHLTIVFIGETVRADEVKRAMDAIKACPFTLTIRGLGRFKGKDGDIYWLGIEKNNILNNIHQQLYESLTNIGFKLENRAFKPHLTLGRQVVLAGGFDEKSFSDSLPRLEARVSKINLFNSHRVNGKLIYTDIYSKDLI